MDFTLFKDQRKSIEVVNSKVKTISSSGISFISVTTLLTFIKVPSRPLPYFETKGKVFITKDYVEHFQLNSHGTSPLEPNRFEKFYEQLK